MKMEKDYLIILILQTISGRNKRNNEEKNICFQTTDDAIYPSNCKIYGGRGESTTSIGMWDMVNDRQIYSYFPSKVIFKKIK